MLITSNKKIKNKAGKYIHYASSPSLTILKTFIINIRNFKSMKRAGYYNRKSSCTYKSEAMIAYDCWLQSASNVTYRCTFIPL